MNYYKNKKLIEELNNISLQIFSLEELFLALEESFETDYNIQKPGNVGPEQGINDVFFYDYKKISKVLINELKKIILQIYNENRAIKSTNINMDMAYNIKDNETYGYWIYRLTSRMMETKPNKNLLLGEILLIIPLIYSITTIILNKNQKKKLKESKKLDDWSISWTEFWKINNKTLIETTFYDILLIAKGIIKCSPGGLIKPEENENKFKYNLFDPNLEEKIIIKKPTINDFFGDSKDFDSISYELCTNYKFIRTEIIPWIINNKKRFNNNKNNNYINTFNKIKEKEILIQELFVYILSKRIDSLILRKNNYTIANEIKEKAGKILKSGGLITKKGKELFKELNLFLLKGNGKLNPGTTADLTTAAIFISKIFDLL